MSKLPGKAVWGGYIYILEYDGGLRVKVGLTTHPRQRIPTLRAEARKFGLAVTKTWVSRRHGNYRANEMALISWLGVVAKKAGGNEHFTGASYDQVKSKAKKLAYETPVEKDYQAEDLIEAFGLLGYAEGINPEGLMARLSDLVSVAIGMNGDGSYRLTDPSQWLDLQGLSESTVEAMSKNGDDLDTVAFHTKLEILERLMVLHLQAEMARHRLKRARLSRPDLEA